MVQNSQQKLETRYSIADILMAFTLPLFAVPTNVVTESINATISKPCFKLLD